MRLVTATAAAMVLASGCGDGLRYRSDDRLRFLEPPQRSVVSGGVLIRWALRERPAAPRGRPPLFGVFVDRTPMRPGEGLEAIAEEDLGCRPEVGCPDREWLARRGVHLTRRTWLALPALSRSGGVDLGDRRRHEVTVVLLDGRGVRRDESAWTLTLLDARGDDD